MSYISTQLKNNEVFVWERCPITNERILKTYTAPYYFYVEDPDGDVTTIYGTKVTKVEFKDSSSAYRAKQQYQEDKVKLWESDISPELRILSNNYYNVPAPKLHVTFYDIEVDYKIESYSDNHQVRIRKRML